MERVYLRIPTVILETHRVGKYQADLLDEQQIKSELEAVWKYTTKFWFLNCPVNSNKDFLIFFLNRLTEQPKANENQVPVSIPFFRWLVSSSGLS